MKKIISLLIMATLVSSCWMLEQPEFSRTVILTQDYNGFNYGHVIGNIEFTSLYHGSINVSCLVYINTINNKTFVVIKHFYNINYMDSKAFYITVDTSGIQMIDYYIRFNWQHN